MSGRIAHRPHYRHTRQVSLPKGMRQPFFHTRWSYRRQSLSYEKHQLGYGLSLIQSSYYAVRTRMFSQLSSRGNG